MGAVSKDAVLEFVDELESGEAVALKASYEENVGAWVSAIRNYLEKDSGAVSFAELVNGFEMLLVAVWIELILGGFKIEQTGDFYGQSIWVG